MDQNIFVDYLTILSIIINPYKFSAFREENTHGPINYETTVKL